MHLQDNPAFIISSSPSPFYLVLGCSVILALISKLDMDLTLVGCFSSQNSAHNTEALKRSIFQTFWKDDCVTKSLFFELDTSNFGYLLIFKFC